jgi:ABC-2 type transport system permease protein
MKHIPAIAGRELRSLFVSPVAYVTLTLFALLAGFFFLAGVLSFDAQAAEAQSIGYTEFLERLNLNDSVLGPFYGVMWIVLLFLIPGITMGLFASEKTNGTQELLLTSPITIWELVLGKYLAGAIFAVCLIGLVGFFTWVLFFYGDPEAMQALSGLLGLLLLAWSYVAVGAFASSVTRNQLIAFFLTLVMLLILWMLAIVADLGAAGGTIGADSQLSEVMRFLSAADRFDKLVRGLVDTRDLAYFAFMIGVFLLLTKTSVESARWR